MDNDSFILTGTAKNTEVRALSYRLKNCLVQCGLDQNISFNILRDIYTHISNERKRIMSTELSDFIKF